MVTVLSWVAGNSTHVVVLTAAAVLTGQLSIGWSNDAIDAPRDIAVGRGDKPLAVGALTRGMVATAAVLSAASTVPLSLALGWRSGAVHLLGIAAGWVYNVRLKATPLSFLPFVVAFGGMPAVATLALPSHPWPPWWALLAAALVGVSAHLGNVLPDLDEDRRTGVRGLPHVLGRAGSAVTATAIGVAATLTVVIGSGVDLTVARGTLLALALLCAAVGLLAVRRDPTSEAAFHAAMVIAALDVALLATSHGLA